MYSRGRAMTSITTLTHTSSTIKPVESSKDHKRKIGRACARDREHVLHPIGSSERGHDAKGDVDGNREKGVEIDDWMVFRECVWWARLESR